MRTKLLLPMFGLLMFGTVAKANNVESAILGCIANADEQLSKSRTNGTSDTTVSVVCDGDAAEALFNAVSFYGSQAGPQEDDYHQSEIIRFFGNLTVPSQCHHVIQDPYGRGLDQYQCFLSIDLNSAVTKAM